ncbi:MAG: M61 family metallopeptidase [Gammaproteobacteria bacterium]
MTSLVHYTITPVSLGGHRFAVTVSVPNPQGEAVVLSLPTWIPGSYLVRDFSKHLGRVTAVSDGESLRVTKLDKSSWRVAPSTSDVLVSYEVYAHDLSVRGAHLDTTHGFFNASSVFLSVEGLSNQSLTVDINPPTDAVHAELTASWRVATTLHRDGASEWGFGRFRAADYAELVDHPVEFGEFELVEFDVAGTPHYFVLSGTYRCDKKRLAKDAARICATQVELIGELPEMERYLFLTRVEASGYGGLEHRACCALVCSRNSLPTDADTLTNEYRKFLGLVSHEYFHLWNVKRIKPAVFTPYELEGESYTELLWVFEGITSYYDDLAMVRSGVITERSYAELLAETISRVRSAQGRHHQTLAESSFDAWTKFYKPDENTPNSVVSYYTKGAMVALGLDLTLRGVGDISLDHIMKELWTRFGKVDTGVPEDGFEDLAAQVSGVHLRPFFDSVIRDVEEPDLEGLLGDMGWILAPAPIDGAPVTSLGVTFVPGTTQIKTVSRDSCAEKSGLASGDTLLAIDELQVMADKPGASLQPYTAGDSVKIHAFRRGTLMHFRVTLEKRPDTKWAITEAPHASDKALAKRALWLHTD